MSSTMFGLEFRVMGLSNGSMSTQQRGSHSQLVLQDVTSKGYQEKPTALLPVTHQDTPTVLLIGQVHRR